MYSILLPPPLDPSIYQDGGFSPGESARARQITHYQEPYSPVAKHLKYGNTFLKVLQIQLWKS